MADRYYGYVPTASGRSPTFNPNRASMPSNVGYSSSYGGDVHVIPASSTRHHTTPRGYTTTTNASGVPTTTRTYAVTQDHRARGGATLAPRESSRTRRSTMDSASRPPVIITTTHGPSGNHSSGRAASRSPVRSEYRTSDGQVLSQPASSIRSRSSARPYHGARSSEDYGRQRHHRDSFLGSRDADAYRNSRPSVAYPSDPRHSTAPLDYGEEGYQYTRPGELVKYDLDHPTRGGDRRRESMERGYYRPNANYHPDKQGYEASNSHDLNRHSSLSARPYEPRGGPPPSTRGFDRVNRDRGYDVREPPPAAPVPPAPATTRIERGDLSDKREGDRRSRPLSLHQASGPRASHQDDYYRSRDDERVREQRDRSRNYSRDRDRDRERDRDGRDVDYRRDRFLDDGVSARVFGGRTDAHDGRGVSNDQKRSSRLEEPKRRSDEDMPVRIRKDREEPRPGLPEELDDRRPPRAERKREDGSPDRTEGTSKVRETLASGLGIAASAVGLGLQNKKSDAVENKSASRDRRSSPPRRRAGPDEYKETDNRADGSVGAKFSPREEALTDRNQGRDRESPRIKVPSSESMPPKEPRPEIRDSREEQRDKDSRLPRDTPASLEPSLDESSRPLRGKGPVGAFDPRNTDDLQDLKAQLAALEVHDKQKGGQKQPLPALQERSPRQRSASPSRERTSVNGGRSASEDSLPPGREIVQASDPRQVRVVSPGRDQADSKPLRGILKQPRVSFPEEDNYVREGVAPHKEDKKIKEAPAGARWTKINRKVVNPEALSIGKERFEVRDDFVIVLRVLSKEEIQAYAAATQVLRGLRDGEELELPKELKDHEEDEDDEEVDKDNDKDIDDRDERHRREHRSRDESDESDERRRRRERDRDRDRDREREKDRDYEQDRDRERRREDDDRRRRQRREDDDYARDSQQSRHDHQHHRHRDHERGIEA